MQVLAEKYPFSKTHTAADPARKLIIALAGNPNAGKTTLFNALTGLRQRVANYPGVTVETKVGFWNLGLDQPAQLIDLPGLYSLTAASTDEKIARDILLSEGSPLTTPDVIVVAVDATNLARNFYLVTQLLDTGKPLVLALTMIDLAESNHLQINVGKLSRLLGIPVVPVVARQRQGLKELAQAVSSAAKQHQLPPAALAPWDVDSGDNETGKAVIARYRWIEGVISATITAGNSRISGSGTTERIDRLTTHKLFGPVILLAIMLLVFQTIFSWANLPMSLIENIFTVLGDAARTHLPPGALTDLLADGIIAGVGGVLVFVPQIFLLFLFISLLEDTGYMARAAFLMDRLMHGFGLHGKAFVPLLSSFACAVPGIMATRTIENPRDRLATILIAPLMSCSARLPIYTLMIATFFSGQKVFGVVSVGALMILAMYVVGITVAMLMGWLLKHTLLKAPAAPFVMELPAYRLPGISNVAHTIFQRVGLFVRRAGTVILAISILLWALAAFPRPASHPAGSNTTAADSQSPIESSYAGRAGHFIEPVIAPLGFDWRIGIGLISSFAARETIISTLSIVYNVEGDTDTRSKGLSGALRQARRQDGSPVWTPLVAVSLMVFFLLACQCMSTAAIVRRETNSWRWPMFMIGYMLVLAYLGSLIVFQGGRLIGFS